MSDESTGADYPAAIGSFTEAVRALGKATRERDEAKATLARLRALHTPWHVCPNVGPGSTDYVADDDVMEPCPTVRIIDGDRS